MSKPLVSVIIATYNRERYIGRAIESVIHQTYPSIEIIVVDDESIDATSAIVERYVEVMYINQPHKGQGAARNNGLRHAKGKYIALLDSDDYWHPDFLSICVDKLESDSLDFVFTNWLQDKGNGEFVNRLEICDMLQRLPVKGEEWVKLDKTRLRDIYLTGCPSPSSSIVILHETLSAKGWVEDLLIADDWCMLMDVIFRQDVTAGFSPLLLWTKNRVGTNLYDGRASFEVAKSLRIKDVGIIYARFEDSFSNEEKMRFKREMSVFLLFHAYHELKHKKQFLKSMVLFRSAFSRNWQGVVSMLFQKFVLKTTQLVYPSKYRIFF